MVNIYLRIHARKKFKSIESFKVDLKEQKFCISCHLPATKAVIFAIPGATLVERCCNECAKEIKRASTSDNTDYYVKSNYRVYFRK